jgi:hypothetical protein
MGNSNRNIEYKCDDCGRVVGKLNLRAKRVLYVELGRNGRVESSRTVGWYCLSCMAADPAYQQERFAASPGMRDTSIAIKPAEEAADASTG